MFWVLKRTISMNRLIEMVLLSTHNICFGGEIRKIIFSYAHFSGGLGIVCFCTFFWRPGLKCVLVADLYMLLICDCRSER